ncbi:MAG: hypothetical protein JWR83_882 [Aeromicrobium sp.]|nr:hypothetical protein [Aeromicrobium sp.]
MTDGELTPRTSSTVRLRRERWALILITAGLVAGPVGWIAGVFLAAGSLWWTTREKLFILIAPAPLAIFGAVPLAYGADFNMLGRGLGLGWFAALATGSLLLWRRTRARAALGADVNVPERPMPWLPVAAVVPTIAVIAVIPLLLFVNNGLVGDLAGLPDHTDDVVRTYEAAKADGLEVGFIDSKTAKKWDDDVTRAEVAKVVRPGNVRFEAVLERMSTDFPEGLGPSDFPEGFGPSPSTLADGCFTFPVTSGGHSIDDVVAINQYCFDTSGEFTTSSSSVVDPF